MRKPHGYALWVDPALPGGALERDSTTCAHCNRVSFIKPFQDASESGGFCRMCYRHTCGPCADLGTCTPFERRLEMAERAERFHDAVGTVEW